ncbi:MAG: HEAT repeat domain-containing protein [Endomicrobiales bacterium]|nr:HEAT repeat domain-containing protein [Endomicrobiales bacterium]
MKQVALALLFILVFCRLNASEYPSVQEKQRVGRIISAVSEISRGCPDIEELGKQTLAHAQEILDMGPSAVYALSLHMGEPDWKVRFWIIDIMGYLENYDAKRPLLRAINNRHEKKAVKEQAIKSLKRLGFKIRYAER